MEKCVTFLRTCITHSHKWNKKKKKIFMATKKKSQLRSATDLFVCNKNQSCLLPFTLSAVFAAQVAQR